MVMDEEKGTRWWLDSRERELVKQNGWIPLSLWRGFLTFVRMQDVNYMGCKYMAEEIWWWYGVAASASSEAEWWYLLAAKQCLVGRHFVLPFSDQTPLCNSGIELQKLWNTVSKYLNYLPKPSLIRALCRVLTLILGVSWTFNVRKFLLLIVVIWVFFAVLLDMHRSALSVQRSMFLRVK